MALQLILIAIWLQGDCVTRNYIYIYDISLLSYKRKYNSYMDIYPYIISTILESVDILKELYLVVIGKQKWYLYMVFLI